MRVTIYTKENCTFCTQAKMLLSSKGVSYEEYKLNEDFSRESLLELFPQAKTFPVIVVDGFNIGGFTELNKFLTENTKDNRKLLNEGI
ncbi:GrxC Glutaredoxin and related proteins [uncultured Caudovirales phage]|uniref:GrxC Glutaredoxin and related proteins n=1 Tax=uncultured Caudovirales phage TaxID=2100421 RepID=A0A6J5P0T9_9CAUD|nr:GrxC Glutaredoxin and related proteins [uncultured Caudovirales phage]